MKIEQLQQKIQKILDSHKTFEGPLFDKIIYYYELQTLIQLTQSIDEKMDASKLIEFLKKHWSNFRQTPLSYTALPNNQTNQLLIEIACFLSPDSPLSVLMPGVSLESIHDDFPNLTGDMDVCYVCQTHILSQECNFLIPVVLLHQWDLLFPDKPLPNPYYDYQKMSEASALIQKESIQALLRHSKQTLQLLDASKHHQSLCQNQTHLYAKLHLLMQHLLINSSIGGLGNELNAGANVYAAIINFNQYYQLLSFEKKSLIPCDVKIEIETILELSTNPLANQSAAENLETCVYSRRAKLNKVVEEHHSILSKIDIHESVYSSLIEESISSFSMQKQQLKYSISNHQYNFGFDKIPLKLELLNKLNIEIDLDSFDDVLHISAIDEHDLDNLLKDENIKAQFLLHFQSLETLVEFCFAMSFNKFKIIFSALADDLASNFNYNPHFFGFWLSLLPEDMGKAMLESFERTWSEIFNDGNDFSQFLQNLSKNQKKWVMSFFLDKFQFFIKNGDDIALVLKNLEPEERYQLFNRLNGHFFELIENATQLGKILNWLRPEQGEIVFSSVLSKFPELITDSHDFNFCFAYLNQTQKQMVISLSIHHIPNIIGSGADFRLVLENLSPEDQWLIWGEHHSILPGVILTGGDFSEACYYLSENQITELIEKFSDTFVNIISNGADFRDAITFLNDKHKRTIFHTCKTYFEKIIQSSSDFSHIMQFLDYPQRRECFDLMKTRLSRMVTKLRDIYQTMNYLTASQSTEFIKLCTSNLHVLIDSITAYNQFVQNLSVENREILYQEFKLHLLDLIISGFDFWSLCETLPYDNRLKFLELIKPKLNNIIKTPNDLGHVLRCFYMNHQYELGLYLWRHLGQLSQSTNDFITILKHLPQTSLAVSFVECYLLDLVRLCNLAEDIVFVESSLMENQKHIFIEAILEKTPKIINNIDDLSYLLRKININKYPSLLERLAGLSNEIIDTAKALDQLIDMVQPANLLVLIAHLFPKLPSLINNSRSFKMVLNLLAPVQCQQIFTLIFPKIPHMIESAEDFSNIICFLTPDQKQKVFNFIELRLLEFSHNICQLAVILEHLESKQKKQILMTHMDKLPKLIQSPQEFSMLLFYFDIPERILLFNQFKQKLILNIEDSNDLAVTLKYLPQDEFILLIQATKYKNAILIQTHQDFINILYTLNPEQIRIFFQQLEDELTDIIETPDDFEKLLSNFSSEQKILIIDLFKYKLSIWLLKDYEANNVKVNQWLGTNQAPLAFWIKDNSKIHCLMKSFKLSSQQDLLKFLIQHAALFFNDIHQFELFSENFSPSEIRLLLQDDNLSAPLQKICRSVQEYQDLQLKLESKMSNYGFFSVSNLDSNPSLLGIQSSNTPPLNERIHSGGGFL